MEEDIHPIVATREGSVGLNENEVWMFVEARDAARNSQEDVPDDRSENDSDGSSIVVISMESSGIEDEREPLEEKEIDMHVNENVFLDDHNSQETTEDTQLDNSNDVTETQQEESSASEWLADQTLEEEDFSNVNVDITDDQITCDKDEATTQENLNLAESITPSNLIGNVNLEEEGQTVATSDESDKVTSIIEDTPLEAAAPIQTISQLEDVEDPVSATQVPSPSPVTVEMPTCEATPVPTPLNDQVDEINEADAGNSSEQSCPALNNEEVGKVLDVPGDSRESELNERDGEAVVEGEIEHAPPMLASIPLTAGENLSDQIAASTDRSDDQDVSDNESSESIQDEERWELDSDGMDGNSPSSLNTSASSSPQHFPGLGRYIIAKPDLLEEANRIEELDQLDYSSLTNQDLPVDLNLANISRERHYVHHPNRRLNLALSFVVAFSMAAVVGFGLGHFIGLSDNFPPRPGCSVTPAEDLHGSNDRFEGWDEADWKQELQRVLEVNAELTRALNVQQAMCESQRESELLRENWDLKHTISRIRYGKPVRSVEDRDTINQLQTENQELRTQVGKLRYRCGQPVERVVEDPPIKPPVDETPHQSMGADPFWNKMDSLNISDFWNHFIAEHIGGANMTRHISERLGQMKTSAANLMSVIETRWQELNNMTRFMDNDQVMLKMKETLEKSAQKIVALGDEMFRSQNAKAPGSTPKSWTDHVERIKLKLESRWNDLKRKFESRGSSVTKKASKQDAETEAKNQHPGRTPNDDWFLLMGKQREKIRKNQHKSDWLFERAKNREQVRYDKKKKNVEQKSKKEKTKNKRRQESDKVFPENPWNFHSS